MKFLKATAAVVTAAALVGGMSVGTLLTIFVVPTIYTLFARKSTPGEITTPALDEAKAA